MRVRAFTIVEVMVVVLIVTAVSALLIPTLLGRVAGSKLSGAARALEFGAALASAEAVERGRIVACVAEREGETWVLFGEVIDADRIGAYLTDDASDPFAAPEPAIEADVFDAETGERTIRVEFASFDGVVLADEPLPLTMLEDGSEVVDEATLAMLAAQEEAEAAAFGEVETVSRWVVGVFFPDGSVRPGRKLYLRDEAGRLEREVRLRPLTGGLEVAPLVAAGPDMLRDEDRDEEDEALPMPGGAQNEPGGVP